MDNTHKQTQADKKHVHQGSDDDCCKDGKSQEHGEKHECMCGQHGDCCS